MLSMHRMRAQERTTPYKICLLLSLELLLLLLSFLSSRPLVYRISRRVPSFIAGQAVRARSGSPTSLISTPRSGMADDERLSTDNRYRDSYCQ